MGLSNDMSILPLLLPFNVKIGGGVGVLWIF
jgi:hypothetical protein